MYGIKSLVASKRVHQDGAKLKFLMFDGVIKHFPNVLKLSFAIHVRSKQAVVDEPKFIGVGIDINAGDNPDAFDNLMSVARILPPDKFDIERIVKVCNRIVKEQITRFDEKTIESLTSPTPAAA